MASEGGAENADGAAFVDEHAASFMKAVAAYNGRRHVRIGILALAAGVGPCAAWWLFLLLTASASGNGPARALICLAIPLVLPLAFLLWWLKSRRQLGRFRSDAESGRLRVWRGRFSRKVWQAEGDDKIYGVAIEGATLYVPHRWYVSMPHQGEAEFAFFPYSHYCWTCDGAIVWQRGDYRFW